MILVGALGAAIITALGAVFAILLKNSRASPESKTADVQVWNMLKGGLVEEIARLGLQVNNQDSKISKQDGKIEDQRKEIATLRSQVAVVPQMQTTIRLAMSYIHTLIEQIVRLNGTPPEPPSGLDLREGGDGELSNENGGIGPV